MLLSWSSTCSIPFHSIPQLRHLLQWPSWEAIPLRHLSLKMGWSKWHTLWQSSCNSTGCLSRLIRDSAPHINTIIIIGCIWILTTCYLLSVDSANPPIDEFVDDPSYSETVDVAEIRNHRYKTRASRSTCTPRKHQCEMTDNINAHVAE